jgi:hypothetical protein
MSEAWDRLITEMIRHMIREFLAHPAELLTFRRLSRLVASDADVLHAIAEQRPDLFMITSNGRFVKLFPDAVERIATDGVEKVIAEVGPVPSERDARRDHRDCNHFSSDEEILADLRLASFRPESLTRSCCWAAVCRVRALNPQAITEETWREVCGIRGYLHGRQNPRGF